MRALLLLLWLAGFVQVAIASANLCPPRDSLTAEFAMACGGPPERRAKILSNGILVFVPNLRREPKATEGTVHSK